MPVQDAVMGKAPVFTDSQGCFTGEFMFSLLFRLFLTCTRLVCTPKAVVPTSPILTTSRTHTWPIVSRVHHLCLFIRSLY